MPDLSHEALSPYYLLRDSTIKKEVVFEVSRYYTESMSSLENTGADWRPWDRVAPHLYLGKMPSLGNSLFSSINQHEQIIEEISKNPHGDGPLGLVVSVVDYFEFAGHSVVTPLHWEQKKVSQRMLPMSDFTANAPNESIIATIKAMRKCIEEGKSVYIHCKAGRSRSAMLCAIYLAIYGNDDALKADDYSNDKELASIESYLIKKRPQVELDDEKRKKAQEIIDLMRQAQSENQLNDHTYTLKELLSSLQLKNAIIHFSSFKKLALYGCLNQSFVRHNQLNEYVKEFFNSIYLANDDSWYHDLISAKGPMQKLINAKSYQYFLWNNEGDRGTRSRLRSEFVGELNNYLTRVLQCSITDIKNSILELGMRCAN